MDQDRRFVIVYQFGKVASTSIVNTLDKLSGVDAVQSHFLGREALEAIVPNMLSPQTSDYFFEHQLGQFQQNVRITRRMSAILCGQAENQRLMLLSLARDPIDWLRSAITQNIEGYLPYLTRVAGTLGIAEDDPSACVNAGLQNVLERCFDMIEETGGIEPVLDKLRSNSLEITGKENAADLVNFRLMIVLILRPFDWFANHYATATGLQLGDLQRYEDHWHTMRNEADYILMRYEDLGESFAPVMARYGLEVSKASKKNISRNKPLNREIREVFAGLDQDRLTRIAGQSDYSRFFGYRGIAV